MSGTAALIVGLVIAIADGDTLTVLDNDLKPIKVRLAEIDAPEKKQPFGTRARQSLGELCHEKRAEVRVTYRDRYGRLVGRVTCDGTDANVAQVRRGLAWAYDRYATDATLYRLAQESVTNALRHARHATSVQVVVTGDDDSVRLTVWDDGDPRPAGVVSSSGFGLLGMAERARLLGGTLEAGPARDRGWTVVAELPRLSATA